MRRLRSRFAGRGLGAYSQWYGTGGGSQDEDLSLLRGVDSGRSNKVSVLRFRLEGLRFHKKLPILYAFHIRVRHCVHVLWRRRQ
jgi:hypothetical protein